MKRSILAILLLLVSPAAVYADFSSAMDAYEQKDFQTAASELKTLANQSDVDAQYMLGYMYALGEGILQDYIEAHKWFNLAASQGKEGARSAREEVAKRMTSTQVARAQQLAREWEPETAEVNVAPTATNTPESDDSRAISRDSVKGVQQRLAELGYAPGPADGAPGKRTRDAIRAYQSDNGLRVDGEISQELIERLDVAADSSQLPDSRYPEVWQAPDDDMSSDAKAFIDELRALLTKAEKQRAADRWLISDLQQMVKDEDRPWPDQLLHEQFASDDYQWNPAWHMDSGRTELQHSVGLHNIVEYKPQPRDRRENDLPRRIFDSFLGRNNARQSDRESSTAEIYIRKPIPNAFALRVQVDSIAEGARIVFKFSRDGEGASDYRLALNSGRRGGVELLRVERSGQILLQSYDRRTNLDDGQAHTVEWLRYDSGEMAVALDGKELFRATDSEISGPYNRVSFAAFGGDYILKEVLLFAADGT